MLSIALLAERYPAKHRHHHGKGCRLAHVRKLVDTEKGILDVLDVKGTVAHHFGRLFTPFAMPIAVHALVSGTN